jgi:hypothetical protein
MAESESSSAKTDTFVACLNQVSRHIRVEIGYKKVMYLLGLESQPLFVSEISPDHSGHYLVVTTPDAIFCVHAERIPWLTIKFAIVTESEERQLTKADAPGHIGFSTK